MVEATSLLNVYINSKHTYPNGDCAQSIVFLYRMKLLEEGDIFQHRNTESLDLRYFSKEEINQLDLTFESHHLMIEEFNQQSFAMGH